MTALQATSKPCSPFFMGPSCDGLLGPSSGCFILSLGRFRTMGLCHSVRSTHTVKYSPLYLHHLRITRRRLQLSPFNAQHCLPLYETGPHSVRPCCLLPARILFLTLSRASTKYPLVSTIFLWIRPLRLKCSGASVTRPCANHSPA